MDDPPAEIEGVIRDLCESTPEIQRQALQKYYLPNASFSHPFALVRTGPNSRQALTGVYLYYNILSPIVKIKINDLAYKEPGVFELGDAKNKATLYVHLTQSFRIKLVSLFFPWVDVSLVVRLELERGEREGLMRGKWRIKHQEDLYPSREWIKFVSPHFGSHVLGFFLVLAAHVSSFLALLIPLFQWVGWWNNVSVRKHSWFDKIHSS